MRSNSGLRISGHLIYVDKDYAVLSNPRKDNRITLIKRDFGGPDVAEVERILKRVHMEPLGEPSWREDGLWYLELREGCNGS